METSTDTTEITVQYRKVETGRYDVYANGEHVGQTMKMGAYQNRTTGENIPAGWYALPARRPGMRLLELTRKEATFSLLVRADVGTQEQRSAWLWS